MSVKYIDLDPWTACATCRHVPPNTYLVPDVPGLGAVVRGKFEELPRCQKGLRMARFTCGRYEREPGVDDNALDKPRVPLGSPLKGFPKR